MFTERQRQLIKSKATKHLNRASDKKPIIESRFHEVVRWCRFASRALEAAILFFARAPGVSEAAAGDAC